MVKNGQKQPKTAFLTVFWFGKIVHPRCKSYFPWMDFSENFSVCSKLPELEFHRLRSFEITLEACFFYRFSKKMLFLRVFYKKKKKKKTFAKNDLWVTWEVWFSFRVVTMCFDAIRADWKSVTFLPKFTIRGFQCADLPLVITVH